MRKAFTLVEVLIVVIILGILATIAVPQFTKMTRRARLAEAWVSLSVIRTAQAIYYLDNNQYGGIDNLDFEAPANSQFNYNIVSLTTTDYNAFAEGNATATSGIKAWVKRNGSKGSSGT